MQLPPVPHLLEAFFVCFCRCFVSDTVCAWTVAPVGPFCLLIVRTMCLRERCQSLLCPVGDLFPAGATVARTQVRIFPDVSRRCEECCKATGEAKALLWHAVVLAAIAFILHLTPLGKALPLRLGFSAPGPAAEGSAVTWLTRVAVPAAINDAVKQHCKVLQQIWAIAKQRQRRFARLVPILLQPCVAFSGWTLCTLSLVAAERVVMCLFIINKGIPTPLPAMVQPCSHQSCSDAILAPLPALCQLCYVHWHHGTSAKYGCW